MASAEVTAVPEEKAMLNGDGEGPATSSDNKSSHSASGASSSKCRCCSYLRYRLFLCCKPCMVEHNERPDPDGPCSPKLRYACLCPPHGKVARAVTLAMSVLLMWGTLWAITGAAALPGGNFFGLTVLLVLCVLGGELVQLMHMPPLLGRDSPIICFFTVSNIYCYKNILVMWSHRKPLWCVDDLNAPFVLCKVPVLIHPNELGYFRPFCDH